MIMSSIWDNSMKNSLKSEMRLRKCPKVSIYRSSFHLDDLDKFKDQKLPLARIKKIMKSDEDVRVSKDYKYLFFIR